MRQLSHVNRKMKATDEDGWDAMIRDAKKKIEDLNFSIQVFQRRKASGEQCPATESPSA